MRSIAVPAWAAIFSVVVACGAIDRAPLRVQNAIAYLPVTTGGPAVAYFDIINQSHESIRLEQVDSDIFARSDWHETVTEDGISRMLPIHNLRLAAGETVSFRPGGKHIMLSDPRTPLRAGMDVRLRVQTDVAGVLEVVMPLRDRQDAGDGTSGGAP